MSDEIPFHIQVEIIKRLPVKPLIQFRSVSKAWKSLIDSSKFSAAHSVGRTQPQHLLVIYQDPVEDWNTYVSFVDDDTFPKQKFVPTLPRSVKLLNCPIMLGSSDGLLCWYENCNSFSFVKTAIAVICNLSFRKSIDVVVPIKFYMYYETILGFGVCPVTSDPKIVNIRQFRGSLENITETKDHCKIKVYALSSGKWKTLSSDLPGKSIKLRWPQVVIDGYIYWRALQTMTIDSGMGGTNNLIMSFDTTNEKFRVIDLPDNLARHPPGWLFISKLRESLVMLEYNIHNPKQVCAVWLMEHAVGKSFTKLFTIKARHAFINTIGFRENGEPLMEVRDVPLESSELVVYEPNSEHFNDLEIRGTRDMFYMSSYVETLHLIGRSDCSSY